MPVVEQLSGRTVTVNGKELLYFSGTSYLGMNKNSNLEALLHEGGKRYGTTYSSSRGSNLKLAIYEQAEEMLAAQAHAEAALTFSSGYLAGQALIRTLDKGQLFLYAPDAHPALWRTAADANHASYEGWVDTLSESIAAAAGDVVLVANAVDPLRAKKYDFGWVANLSATKQITLVIDDSHGFGLLGQEGSGIYPVLQKLLKPNVSLIAVSSLGKALGIAGGVVLGSDNCIQALQQSPYFRAGSPAPPAYLYALVHAQNLYEEARQQLKQNVIYFQEKVQQLGLFDYFDTYPVFYTAQHSLSNALENDAIISCFPYPDAAGEPITRIVLNSLHTRDDLDFLAERIEAYQLSIKV